MKIKQYNVGIYCRLSVEDEIEGASLSIKNQKKYITDYCKKNNYKIYDYYIDDGFSGTNYNRPSFVKLMEDIESGLINMVITKDLSRLGRNYLYTGYLLESYFIDHNVRYIAILDNYDSLTNENELTPFKNLMNEYYAKDVSKKIRFSVQNNIKNGVFQQSAMPIYGYMHQNGIRVPDPNTAPVVRYIFELYKNKMGFADIAYELEQKKIMTPMHYAKEAFGYINPIATSDNKYKWSSTVLARMIDSKEYLGSLIRGKTTSKFKSKSKHKTKEDEQYIFDNKYEAIVDIETWNICHKLREEAKLKFTTKPATIYSGKCFCKTCGGLLRYKKDVRKDGTALIRMTCRTPNEPTRGRITIEELDQVIAKELQYLKKIVLSHEQEFLKLAVEATNGRIDVTGERHKKEKITALNDTITKQDDLIMRAFEDYSNMKISESDYKDIIRKCMTNKEHALSELEALNKEIIKLESNENNYYEEAQKYIIALKELKPYGIISKSNLDSLISKIVVSTDGPKRKRQKDIIHVEITYKAIDPIVKEFINQI